MLDAKGRCGMEGYECRSTSIAVARLLPFPNNTKYDKYALSLVRFIGKYKHKIATNEKLSRQSLSRTLNKQQKRKDTRGGEVRRFHSFLIFEGKQERNSLTTPIDLGLIPATQSENLLSVYAGEFYTFVLLSIQKNTQAMSMTVRPSPGDCRRQLSHTRVHAKHTDSVRPGTLPSLG